MTSKPKQQYRDLEKLGFLCRWALLTLVAVVTLAATWAALAGTFAISSNLETSVILSDAVWRQGVKNPSLLGFLDGRPSRSVTLPATPLFVYSDPFRTLRLSSINNRGEIVSYLATPPAGTHHITLTGLPYGPMAFKQYQSTLRIVPAPMTVYLLDARFMAQVEQDNKQSAIRIAREFSRLGQPVLLLPGDRELLEDLQTRLEQYRDVPRVFSLRKGRTELPSLIASVTWNLKNRDKTFKGAHRKPYVVTADVKVALAAAGKKHYTHLVGTKNIPANLPPLIRLHETPEKLAEHLANERPTLLPIE